VPRPPRQPGRSRGRLVSWPLYRLLLVICLIPGLAAFLFVREPALPEQPTRELTFDGTAAANQAAALVSLPGSRAPGGSGTEAAADKVSRALKSDGYSVENDTFAPQLPGRGAVVLRNVIGFQRGTSPQVIAVIAHRDGIGTGADDNDSSTGVMLELDTGEPFPAPFFLFGEKDLTVLEPGWKAWLAAEKDEQKKEDESTMLRNLANEYQKNKAIEHRIQLLRAASDWFDLWEVVVTANGEMARVVVPARDSLTAEMLALKKYPGASILSTRILNRRY